SNDAEAEVLKRTDDIAFHIYTKAFQLIYAARASDQGPPSDKIDKWFNLETSAVTESSSLATFRLISSLPSPLTIQVLLAVPSSKTLIHIPTSTHIFSGYRLVLLEQWLLDYGRWSPGQVQSDGVLPEPSTIHKTAISLFRSLFSLLRILPAWRTTQEI
ncbi:autophagy-related protein 13, partial [Favolaschia claudopus]